MTTLFNKSVSKGFVLRTPEGMYLSVRTGIGFGRTDVSETHELRRASVHARFLNYVEKEALRKTGYVNFEHVSVEVTRTVELKG